MKRGQGVAVAREGQVLLLVSVSVGEVLSRTHCAPGITLRVLNHGRRDVSRVERGSALGVTPINLCLLTERVMAVAPRAEVLRSVAWPTAGV